MAEGDHSKQQMLESVKQSLESTGKPLPNLPIEQLPNHFYDSFILNGFQIDSIEPGRVLCSFKIPPRLLNTGNFLHGGATASVIDLIGSAAILSTGATTSGVSLEITVSYLDAAYLNEEIEVDAKVLRVGRAIGVVNVELRKKKSGKLVATGRHTKYLTVSSKL